VRGGGECKRRILIGQSVPPPLLEWHSDVLSCHLRMDVLMKKTEDRKSCDIVSLDLDPDTAFISKVKIKT
jgi:hypothetical protein